jgi:hypothetical protein
MTQVLHFEFAGDPELAPAVASQWDQGVRAVFEGLRTHVEAAAAPPRR